MLIKLDTQEYPVALQTFRERFPQTSFPQQINYAEWGYGVVFPAPAPAHDPLTQYARELPPILTAKGHWEQQWEILELDAETIAAKQAETATEAKLKVRDDLLALDLKSIRALREYVATQVDAPKFVKDHEAMAIELRSQL